MIRLIEEGRPRYAIFENVEALRTNANGLDFESTLRALAQIGYDVEWDCISACEVGKPHKRERIWLVAYPIGLRRKRFEIFQQVERRLVLVLEKGHQKLFHFATKRADLEWIALQGISQYRGDHDGISTKLDEIRIRLLGNSLVPAIPELIGRVLLERESCETESQALKK